MRYLVTGGAGFIGSHLVEHRVTEGHQVVVLDDLSTGRVDNLNSVLDRIQLAEGSVTDPETCRAVMRQVDFVLHQAALTSVSRSVAEPMLAHDVNVSGTINVLLAARDAGVRRVVYAGSTYGDGNQTRDFTFVTNVVHANLLACHAPTVRVAGQVFNVGCGRQVTINEVWHRIQQLVGVQLPARRADPRPGEVRHSFASIENARVKLGYAPQVDFDEALRRTVDFYRRRASATDRPRATVPRRNSKARAREG